MPTQHTHHTENQSLSHFPINIFASAMGFAGLSLAWMHAGIQGAAGATSVSEVLRIFTSLLFVVLLLTYAIKVFRHADMVRQEMAHPIKLNFFATIPISLILLSQMWLLTHETTAVILWIAGTALMLITTLLTFYSWLHHPHYRAPHLNPAWFIPVVGNILVPIAGIPLGFEQTSWFFFSIGIVFWFILLTIIVARLIFEAALPVQLQPTLFILLAPPSVGFLALTALEGYQVGTFSQILFDISLFLALVLATSAHRFLRLPFFISGWAYAFPIAALTIACLRMQTMVSWPGLEIFSITMLALLSGIVLWLSIKTVTTAMRGLLFIPEPAK